MTPSQIKRWSDNKLQLELGYAILSSDPAMKDVASMLIAETDRRNAIDEGLADGEYGAPR